MLKPSASRQWKPHIMQVSWLPFGIFLGVFSTVINAVSYNDAFNKELIHYNYYKFNNSDSFEVIDSSTTIGFNGLNQFISIDVASGELNWMIQDLAGVNQFAAFGSTVYLYSNTSNTVSIVELYSGILIRSIQVSQPVTKVINFFNKGVLALQTDGSLHFINAQKYSQIQLDHSIKSDKLVFQQLNGFVYIITYDGYLIKLNSNYQVVNQVQLPASKISQFQDFTLVTESNQIFRVLEAGSAFDLKPVTNSYQNLHIISSNYFYSTESRNKVVIYSIQGNKVETVWETGVKDVDITKVELTPFALSDYLVVTKSNGSKQVFDLTDLLIINDPFSIKEIKIKSDLLTVSNAVDFIVSTEDDIPQLVVINESLDGAVYDINDGSVVNTFAHSTTQFLPSDPSIVSLIIDKPSSKKAIKEVDDLLKDSSPYVLKNWIKRTFRHLSELGKYITSFIVSTQNSSDSEEINDLEDDFGFVKYVIFYDQISKALVAINSQTGKLEWKSFLNFTPRQLLQVNSNIIVVSHDSILELDAVDGTGLSSRQLEDGKTLIKVQGESEESYILGTAQYFKSVSTYNQDIYLFKSKNTGIEGHKLIKGSKTTIATWNFIPQQGESIITTIAKDFDSTTASIGIPLADKSILYKYLNPNVIAVLTKTSNHVLKLYLIDGISGNLLSVFEHPNKEIVDFSSVNIIIDDNWIIYTYFVKSPRLEQRINVIDLFDSNKSIKSSEDDVISSFTHNSTINSYTKKSFSIPERIVGLSSTKSGYGITLKSIVVLTESGYLMEIPKYILNSRRIDNRPLVPDDYISDFKVSAYEPVIHLNTLAILNHKHKLIVGPDNKGSILIKPTHFESTSVICYLNKYNHYCALVQPSLSFDILGHGFERIKLLITIVALLAVYIITKPFVSNKKLNDQWLHS